MSHSTGSNPAADSHTQARIAAARKAAEAAEAARVAALHQQAARDYQSQAAARAQHNAATR